MRPLFSVRPRREALSYIQSKMTLMCFHREVDATHFAS